MPSLDRNTADGLVDAITDLRRQVAELARLRRRPSPGATLEAANTSQTFAGSSTAGDADLVTLGTVVVDTADMADAANSRIVLPADGVYLVAWTTGALEQSADYGFDCLIAMSVRDTAGAIVPGTYRQLVTVYGYGRDTSHVAVCPLEAGETLRLFCQSLGAGIDHLQNPSATGGSTIRFRLTVERLHDLPAPE